MTNCEMKQFVYEHRQCYFSHSSAHINRSINLVLNELIHCIDFQLTVLVIHTYIHYSIKLSWTHSCLKAFASYRQAVNLAKQRLYLCKLNKKMNITFSSPSSQVLT